MKQHLPWLNHFKIRASYGEVGNDRIGNRRFPYLTLINFNNSGRWGSGGLTESQIGADNLHWEVAKKYNLGFDFQLFNDKIGGTIDFFRDTRDNIFQERQMMPVEVGVVTNPYTNVGRMRSEGIDGNIYWAVSFIGIITFTLSAIGVRLGSLAGVRYKSKAELAGGIILIAIGAKILIEHLVEGM